MSRKNYLIQIFGLIFGVVISSLFLVLLCSAQEKSLTITSLEIEKTAIASIDVAGYPDFLELGYGSVWISNEAVPAVQRLDPKTNKIVAEVKMKEPCGAMAIGFDSLWIADCKDKTIVRIDPQTNRIIATIPVSVADSETSIAAGADGVWVLSDKRGVLSRINPKTDKVIANIKVRPNSFCAMFGYGAVWITNTENNSVQRINPKTNKITATISVGGQPRFLAVGEGGVWTLNQTDGTVSRINPKNNQIAATIEVGVSGKGGDIAVGEGFVWVRAVKILLSAIDPKTNRVISQFVPPAGSGSVRAGNGAVWISAHDINKVWRLKPKQSN